MAGSALKNQRYEEIKSFLGNIFDSSLHAKRVESLANGTMGIMKSASLAVCTIGQALAQAREILPKHGVKQVDRLLSNTGIDVWKMFSVWVPEVVGDKSEVVVALDWTEFDHDGQATLALNLVTPHGRATPLIWLSVWKDELQASRNAYEDAVLVRLAETLPDGVKVTVLADRGFGDRKLLTFLDQLGFDYVIRIRGNISVTAADGEKRPSAEWVGKSGRARKLRNAQITAAKQAVPAIVCMRAKGMKEPWCLVTGKSEAPSSAIKKLYSRRWTIEPSFRDTKDLRFGMGMSAIHISDPERRDRLLLLNALATLFLTLLGEAGEELGWDRALKTNTAKRRTHSLFRQGCMLYDLIPNMSEERLKPLIEQFSEKLHHNRVAAEVFATA